MNILHTFSKELKIAFMNLFRNKRRTLLTLFSVIFGTVFLMGFEGYVNIMEVDFRDQLIKFGLGHFQIHKGEYETNEPFSIENSFTVDEVEKINSVINSLDNIKFTAPRISLSGLIGNGVDSNIFIGHAGLPEYEKQLGMNILEGGTNISDEQYKNSVLGIGLAQKIDAEIGDTLVLTSQNEFGGLEATNIIVSGISDFSSKQLNEMYIITHLENAQELLFTDNIQYFIVMLDSIEGLDETIQYCNEELEKFGINVNIKRWDELTEIYTVAVTLFRTLVFVALVVIMFVVIFSISNTIFMAVLERVPEIGTLRAIGISRFEILRIILLESLFIAIIGIFISIIIVLIMEPVINSLGITLPPSPGVPYRTPVKIMITFGTVLKFSIINLFVTLIASIFPSIRGANTNIARAIKML